MRYSGACLSLCIMPHAKLKNDAVGVDAESCNERPEPEPEVSTCVRGRVRASGWDRVGVAGRRTVCSEASAAFRFLLWWPPCVEIAKEHPEKRKSEHYV